MPNHVIFIRHGQSEANVVQKDGQHGVKATLVKQIFDRPDWQHRLTSLGVEQAVIAGAWFTEHIGPVADFDALYVSPFYRTRETAAYVGGNKTTGWTIDDRLAERGWGVYGKLSREEQSEKYPLTAKEKSLNPWYIRLDGGESMLDVYARFRDFQGTLHREQDGKRVIIVTHGDFMNAARYGIERMTPEEWEEVDRDGALSFKNCMILEYTRVNPKDAHDVRDRIHWRRYTNPVDLERSPYSGEWVELKERRRYSGKELLHQAEHSPRILGS